MTLDEFLTQEHERADAKVSRAIAQKHVVRDARKPGYTHRLAELDRDKFHAQGYRAAIENLRAAIERGEVTT
jgi:transcriptional regulator GlxA family with amidase domain